MSPWRLDLVIGSTGSLMNYTNTAISVSLQGPQSTLWLWGKGRDKKQSSVIETETNEWKGSAEQQCVAKEACPQQISGEGPVGLMPCHLSRTEK